MNEVYGYALFYGVPGLAGLLALLKAFQEHRRASTEELAESRIAWLIVSYLFLCPLLLLALTRVSRQSLANLSVYSMLFLPVFGLLLLPAGLVAIFRDEHPSNRFLRCGLLVFAEAVSLVLLMALLAG